MPRRRLAEHPGADRLRSPDPGCPRQGKGWKLSVDTGEAGAYVEIANLTSIKLPAETVAAVETTVLGGGAHRTYDPSDYTDSDSGSATAVWTDAAYTTLVGLKGDKQNYRVSSNAGTPDTYTWGAFITSVGEMEVSTEDNQLTFDFEFKPYTAVTIA